MSDDIGKILENWDYRLGRVDARRVTGDDGSDKLQMRIDLGLLQMNAQFRPDGKRPFGHPTLLDHFLLRLEKHRNKNGGEDDDFSINSDECAKLQQEAIQFHHRSICNFELNDFEAVERDTDHQQVAIRGELYKLEGDMPPVDVMFLYKIVDWVGDLADRAQKVGGYLHMLVAR